MLFNEDTSTIIDEDISVTETDENKPVDSCEDGDEYPELDNLIDILLSEPEIDYQHNPKLKLPRNDKTNIHDWYLDQLDGIGALIDHLNERARIQRKQLYEFCEEFKETLSTINRTFTIQGIKNRNQNDGESELVGSDS